jgi:hypothetical protein
VKIGGDNGRNRQKNSWKRERKWGNTGLSRSIFGKRRRER